MWQPKIYDPIGHRLKADQGAARKREAFERIAAVLLALDAHLVGDYVSEAIAREQPEDVATLEAVLPTASAVRRAVAVMRVTLSSVGAYVDREATTDGVTFIAVKNDIDDGQVLRFELRSQPSRGINNGSGADIAFDRQALAMSRSNLYVRSPGCGTATVQTLLQRARARVFCLAPSFCKAIYPLSAMTSKLHGREMHRAAEMVRHGWKMDDALAGRDAWVVATWAQIEEARHGLPGSKTYDECSICQEGFSPEDTVVNLPCNHNFHVACPILTGYKSKHKNNNNGLCGWLERGNATCPCCRAPAFYVCPQPRNLPYR